MKDTLPAEIKDASLKEVGFGISEQIELLNNPYVWRSVLKIACDIHDKEAILSISQANVPQVSEIAHVTAPGMILGYETFQPMLAKYPLTPIGTATLAAIEGFPSQIRDYTELTHRIASVLGTTSELGAFGKAMADLEEEVLEGQPMFMDMLQVYGSHYVSRNSL